MAKSKTAKRPKKARAPKTSRPTKAALTAGAPKEKTAREDLCVFAFRLTAEERSAIHKAAGPAKASKFVRSLAVAAARGDEASVRAIMGALRSSS